MNDNYFLIPTSNKNNLIYLFITQTPEGERNTGFAVDELRVLKSRGTCYKPSQ